MKTFMHILLLSLLILTACTHEDCHKVQTVKPATEFIETTHHVNHKVAVHDEFKSMKRNATESRYPSRYMRL